jgi:hypothetical protein
MIVLMLALGPALVMPHGTGQHVLGTVIAIDATHIKVKTQKGASVSVNLTDKTTFTSKMKRPSGRPEPGDRVVIEVMTEGNVITATEVQYSNPKPKEVK